MKLVRYRTNYIPVQIIFIQDPHVSFKISKTDLAKLIQIMPVNLGNGKVFRCIIHLNQSLKLPLRPWQALREQLAPRIACQQVTLSMISIVTPSQLRRAQWNCVYPVTKGSQKSGSIDGMAVFKEGFFKWGNDWLSFWSCTKLRGRNNEMMVALTGWGRILL